MRLAGSGRAGRHLIEYRHMLDPLARRGYTNSAGQLAGRRDSGRLSLCFFHHLNRRSRRQERIMFAPLRAGTAINWGSDGTPDDTCT